MAPASSPQSQAGATGGYSLRVPGSPWRSCLRTASPVPAVDSVTWDSGTTLEQQYSGHPLGALTLEAGPLPGVPMPAPLHEAQETLAGAGPGSADRRQLGAVALHHFHHDVQDVLLICKGQVHRSGQLRGAEAGFLIFGRSDNRGKVWGTSPPSAQETRYFLFKAQSIL